MIEDKIAQLLSRLESPLTWCKSELEDFLGEDIYDNKIYVDLILSMNLRKEIIELLKEINYKKHNSSKFKQKSLFNEDKKSNI